MQTDSAETLSALFMPPTKLQRWLDLIAFLVARRFPVSVEQIMEGVPTYSAGLEDGTERGHERVRRMFERDKVDLREAGIPIETVQYDVNYGEETAEGYRLGREDFHLPYVRLLTQGIASRPQVKDRARKATAEAFEVTEAEIGAVLDGLNHVRSLPASPLAAAATSAFRKLTFDLPTDFPAAPTALYLDPPGVSDSRSALRLLTEALQRSKSVTFPYHGIRRGQPTDRHVEPYGLMFRQSRWYLVGRDTEREAVRVFRVSRMSEPCLNPKRPRTPDYKIPPGFELSRYAEREAWQLGQGVEKPLRARVLFRFPQSLWADRNGHGTLVEGREDGSSVREFEMAETAPFLRWLLPQGDDVIVQRPGELREELRRMAERVAHRHQDAHSPIRRTWRTLPKQRATGDDLGGVHTMDRLQRLLYVIARASTPHGAVLAELASDLEVSANTILDDLREVEERDLHHPAGAADDLQIAIEADRVRVWTSRDLKRPTKLTPRETLALWFGLEISRVSDGVEGDRRSDLRKRVNRYLTQHGNATEPEPAFAAPALGENHGALRRRLTDAIAARKTCSISYLKLGAEPRERRVDPYVVVHAEGTWYLLGREAQANDVRTFRLDRILAVHQTGEHFDPVDHFDPKAHLDVRGGRALRAPDAAVAVVRYSASIARWIAEEHEGERADDGSFVVRHPLVDPEWLVRHVLAHTDEAEVVEPSSLRQRVLERAQRIAELASTRPPRGRVQRTGRRGASE